MATTGENQAPPNPQQSKKQKGKGKEKSKGTGGLDNILRLRKEKAEELASAGWPSFPNGYQPKHTTAQVREAGGEAESSDEPQGEFLVAGRLLAKRRMGKRMFCDLWDRTGKIQLSIQKDLVGEEEYERCKKLDMGDFVLAGGGRFVTKTGELTLQINNIRLLTKSMYPLPDKHAGIHDVEMLLRQRYVDLAVSPESRERFVRRSRLIRFIRGFLEELDFLEVETPMLHSLISGATAKPFTTHHNALDIDLFMRIAPELHLKRLLVGGFERVYEIGRNFRNEGLSTQHNPEFTMLEFYYAYATYDILMDLTEQMLRGAAKAVTGQLQVPFKEHTIDFEKPFARIPVRAGLAERLPDVDISDLAALREQAQKRGLHLDANVSLGKAQMELFEHIFEPELIQPTFVMDFPIEVSPLARKKDSDPSLTDRFELYIGGFEVANAFSELNDPDDQKARFVAQVEAKKTGDDEAMDYDEDYIHALEIGMPPAAGEGVGIDRLCMILTDSPSIRDVILFPQTRPETAEDSEK